MIFAKNIGRQGQEGATLLVALILLLIMTIVGIGASQVSKMQYQMARNTQFELDMYQLTLSENNAQIKSLNENNKLIDDNTSNFSSVNIESANLKLKSKIDTKADLNSQFQILGRSDAPKGFSLGTTTPMQTIIFQFDTSSSIKNSSIGSKQTQGLSILSPSTPIL